MKVRFTPIKFCAAIFISCALLFLAPILGFSQPTIPPEHQKLLDYVATYTTDRIPDKTYHYLLKFGFNDGDGPDGVSVLEFDRYPTIRRYETAYLFAENKEKGKGMQLLQSMLKDLSQEFESVREDPHLQKYLNRPYVSYFEFEKYKIPTNPPVPKEVKRLIFKISCYTEQGALGGTLRILRDYFQINEDVVYDIMRGSKTAVDALSTGYSISKTPPSKMDQLFSIMDDLHVTYESMPKTPSTRVIMPNEKQLWEQTKKKVYPYNNIKLSLNKAALLTAQEPPKNSVVVHPAYNFNKLPSKASFYIKFTKTVKFPNTVASVVKSFQRYTANSPNKYVKSLSILASIGAVVYVTEELTEDDQASIVLPSVEENDSLNIDLFRNLIYTSHLHSLTNTKPYMVIIASEPDLENAERKLLEAHLSGFDGARIGVFNCGKYFSVIGGDFDSMEEANRFLVLAKQKVHDAYINPYQPQISPCPQYYFKK